MPSTIGLTQIEFSSSYTFLGNPYLQTMFHGHNDGITWGDRMIFHHLYAIIIYNGSCNYLHLNKRHLLTQTTPWSCIESWEFVRRFVLDSSSHWNPSLWLELQTVFAPYTLHSSHGVEWQQSLCVSINLVPTWKYVCFNWSFVLQSYWREQP